MAVHRSVVAIVVAAWLGSSANDRAQTVPSAVNLTLVNIAGRVLDDETGVALSSARVAVGGAVTLTDADGRFALSAPANFRTISANKTGFARRDESIPAAGPLEIRLARGAAVSGRVIDESGEPVANIQVALELPRESRDDRVAARTSTDDRGDYRFGGLSAGTFLASVTTRGRTQAIRSGTAIGYVNRPFKRYYPGVTAVDDGQPLTLRVGEERGGIDFVLTTQEAIGQAFAVDSVALGIPPDFPAPQRGTGGIRGRVTNSEGLGLAQARVLLMQPRDPGNPPTQPYVGRTGPDGRFEFAGLAAGRYRVAASKGGYLPGAMDDRLPDGTPAIPAIDLSDGETRDRVEIALTRFGTITGRVLDEYGAPMGGARVQALRVQYEAGRRQLVPLDIPVRLTDDRGAYRLYGMPRGQFMVSATIGAVGSEDLPGYGRTYFPGTGNAGDAQFVAVGRGQDVIGIDISLARSNTARVSGRMVTAAGQPAGGALLLVPSARTSAAPMEAVGARILPDGRFEFRNVPPGEYVVQLSQGRSNPWTEGEFGALPVAVNGADVTDLVVQTTNGSSVQGTVTFDAAASTKLPAPSALEISALPVDPDSAPPGPWANARFLPDWRFEMYGLAGSRRLVPTRLPAGWMLREIRVNGVDVTDQPTAFGRADQSLAGVEIVLSERVSELTGTVTDESNRLLPHARVIVFAADRDRWFPGSRFLRIASANDSAAFSIRGLPFASYYIAAVSDLPDEGAEAWQDPAFLTSLISRSRSLTISEGQRVTQNLTLSSR